MLWHALRAVCVPPVELVFVVLAPHDRRFAEADWSAFAGRVEPLYCGGDSRRDSVYNGLVASRDEIHADDWVLVHDAARPCLGENQLNRLLDELAEDEVGGLLAVPVADTLKRSRADKRVERTESRENLWQAQTPQMFRYQMLMKALSMAGGTAMTDDAGAIEALGLHPKLVLSDARNLKVTYPQDLMLAELILTNSS
jgi:2-C-methyl-D-erythritol 4-phosphate cytidylyltransferase